MKIAVVYNRASEKVINLLGRRNRERYGKKSIQRVVDSLRKGGHQVIALEGDKDLIDALEEFMPRVVKGERPGMVFNLAYGIQGQARYTHVPGILEMVGIPYVGSGPMAHSLALDKVVAKMIFAQNGLSTPEFAVLETPDSPLPEMAYPLIVKPRNEAVSFGIEIVEDEKELRSAAGVIFEKFSQPVLVERFIAGREINVGLIGNSPPEPLPPAELIFGEGGPQIYTYEDKTHKSGREVGVQCPADLSEELTAEAQKLAVAAFSALGCLDCARVDMRMDSDGRMYLLEINSLPSLGEHGSYVAAAEAVGLDFAGLVNRLVEVASARYFGTPQPPELGEDDKDPAKRVFSFITERRDRIERRIADWTKRSSRTSDPIGLRGAFAELGRILRDVGLRPIEELTDEPVVSTWETPAGVDGGTLLIGHIDVPLPPKTTVALFHRDPEWLYGEGIGSSRAPLVMLEFALRALRRLRKLRQLRLGVLYYGDEGRDCADSEVVIRKACERAGQVLVLRPGTPGDRFITQRRGMRRYELRVEGPVHKLGVAGKKPEVLRWLWQRLERCAELSSRKDRVAVSVGELKTTTYRSLLPHEVRGTILVNYIDAGRADELDRSMREILGPARDGVRWWLELRGHRPPMPKRRDNELADKIKISAADWEIHYDEDSSLMPSVAGLVPEDTDVMCGVGPTAVETFTAQEAVQRISVIQRTLLLTQFLLRETRGGLG